MELLSFGHNGLKHQIFSYECTSMKCVVHFKKMNLLSFTFQLNA